MSIAIMTQVWQRSQHKGSELLLLLALADNANDQGVAYPSRRTLAKKTRMSDRHVKRLVQVLIRSGELVVHFGSGPRGCNEYQITLAGGQDVPRRISSGGHPGSKRGDIAVSPESDTEPREKEDFSLSPTDLKRVGLTPGSLVWRSILGPDA
jgi:helix-turn-helix protein